MIRFTVETTYHSQEKVNVKLTPVHDGSPGLFNRLDGGTIAIIGLNREAAAQFVEGGEYVAEFKQVPKEQEAETPVSA